MSTKVALVTGITGQDGAYLAEWLLEQGYCVHGIKRRSSLFNTDRIDHLYQEPHESDRRFILHHGDMTDTSSLIRIIQQVQPDEIYNLAAQSHVAVSFEEPEYTADSDGLGALRLLEAIRILGLERKTRFYQASTSELYGLVQETPQRETTPFYPRSPYAVAKLYAYWITVNYREAYGIYACNGILFNHECITGETPLLVRQAGVIDVVTPASLWAGPRPGCDHYTMPMDNLDIWDGTEWTALHYLTATKRQPTADHQLVSLHTDAGVVQCTAHHHVLTANETPMRADQVQLQDALLTATAWPAPAAWTVLTPEWAELLGLLAARGHVPCTEQRAIEFTPIDSALQQRIAELWSRLLLGTVHVTQSPAALVMNSAAPVQLTGVSAATQHWLHEQLYTAMGYQRVPRLILNATVALQTAFLTGYASAAGLTTTPAQTITTNSAVFAQGLLWLYVLQGRSPAIDCITAHGDYHYRLTLAPHSAQYTPRMATVAAINAVATDAQWVFDVNTATGKLLAGVGQLVIHNSPIRGETFVTRKITRALARIKLGLQERVYLGNLNAKRDWGHARDYVRMQWLMLQQDHPEDYVIATGQQYSVRDFVNIAAQEIGMTLRWDGDGVNEKGYDQATGRCIVAVDPRYFRPTEVETLLGDASKAKRQLGWEPRIPFAELVTEMMRADLIAAERDALCHREGFTVLRHNE